MASPINIEYSESTSKSEDKRFLRGLDLKKEITKYNSKIESLKQMKTVTQRKEERKKPKNALETQYVDVPENDDYSEPADVKNKLVVLDSNKINRGYRFNNNIIINSFSDPKNIKSFNKNGLVYKTHIIRNKFSSSSTEKNFLENVNIMSPRNEMNEEFHMENHLARKESALSDNSDEISDNKFQPTPNEFNGQTSFTNMRHNIPNEANMIINSGQSQNFSQTATTIYKVLGKRKKEFIDNLFKFSYSGKNTISESVYQKKNFLKPNTLTYYMDMKNKGDEVPHVFPVAWSYNNNYNNFSEKHRYEKITELFLKLRYFVQVDEENDKKYIKEFMMKNGIYDRNYYSIDKLINFRNFLNSKMQINASKTVKEIIIDATNYNEEEERNKIVNEVPFNSQKAKLIINNNIRKNRMMHKKNKMSEILLNESFEKNKLNNHASNNHLILDEKKFKLDLNNPQAIIEGLEEEFVKLKNGIGGLTFLPNEYEVASRNHSMIKQSSQSVTGFKNKNKNKKNHQKNERYSSSPEESVRISNDMKTPKVPKELDIDQIRKKNKLLEYIVLQRSKSKYQLQQDLKKFKITEI